MTSKFPIKSLVLDDDQFMLKLLVQMLDDLGVASISACDSGRAALRLLEEGDNHPDLILLDLNMPEMDGIVFVRHLAERGYAGKLILVSGEDERVLQSVEKLVKAHNIALLGRLIKPVMPEKLAVLLERWVGPSQVSHTAKNVYGPEDLRTAIANGDLVNYYQPKIRISTGEVVGVEALVRWNHSVDGIVFPDQFIGIAEQHGLIDELARVVLTEAFAQARTWQDAGLELRVAVNLSIDNLAWLGFTDFVADLSAKAGVPPQEIVLELTESRLMHDARVPLEILTRLNLKRFRLSIDDFGTGHSSMAQLCDIPFNELKIDQSFVHGAWFNNTQRVMFDASLGLAKQLGMEVVAEGVEDQEDWNFLRKSQCDLAQGYFIAKPMPAASLYGWIQSWEASGRAEFSGAAPH